MRVCLVLHTFPEIAEREKLHTLAQNKWPSATHIDFLGIKESDFQSQLLHIEKDTLFVLCFLFPGKIYNATLQQIQNCVPETCEIRSPLLCTEENFPELLGLMRRQCAQPEGIWVYHTNETEAIAPFQKFLRRHAPQFQMLSLNAFQKQTQFTHDYIPFFILGGGHVRDVTAHNKGHYDTLLPLYLTNS